MINVKTVLKVAALVSALSLPLSFAQTASAGDIKSWQTSIVKLVAKKQVYPRAAMADELEGKAKVKISIDRSGAITSHELIESSGHEVFDQEVEALVARINPLPTPPAELSDNNLSFVLPLTWAIN
ncbi:energy transducer TonB [Emcibacter nanhaiensis]|uniref:Protein TonB n=1 Tax=Emcibacter nanhaiensis TaxID=1505037 RepID=A0A501PQ72_9PROT|nr:TonB family protein [Emcibacter nanhaiensis]TPD61936.1 energy transducer TonB [Emcibacter nanhaiensis]